MPDKCTRVRRTLFCLFACLAVLGMLRAPSARAEVVSFRTQDGRTLHTNVPLKYRGRVDYVEVKLDRIAVDAKYERPEKDLTNATKAEIISHYAKLYGVNENLVYAVIKAESNFDTRAVSSAGARGLMQLMPGTAADMGVTDIFDVAQNIAGGTQYLSKMLEMFNNNLDLALAGYNAGPGAVQQYKGIPPYRETQDYVRIVKGYLREFQTSGTQIKLDHLARVAGAVSRPLAYRSPTVRPGTRDFLVEFKSGLTQPADRVEEKGPQHYLIVYGARSYMVSKDLVAAVKATGK